MTLRHKNLKISKGISRTESYRLAFHYWCLLSLKFSSEKNKNNQFSITTKFFITIISPMTSCGRRIAMQLGTWQIPSTRLCWKPYMYSLMRSVQSGPIESYFFPGQITIDVLQLEDLFTDRWFQLAIDCSTWPLNSV